MLPRLPFELLPGLSSSSPGLGGRSFPGVGMLWVHIHVTRRMVKLSGGKGVCPFLRVVGTEDAKVYFNLLIGSFYLSISLRVICGGEFDIIVEESC